MSSRFLWLGKEIRHRYDVYPIAEPELSEMAEETGEHVLLVIEDGGLGVILILSVTGA